MLSVQGISTEECSQGLVGTKVFMYLWWLCPDLWLYPWEEKLLEEIVADTSKARRGWGHDSHCMVLVQIFLYIKSCVNKVGDKTWPAGPSEKALQHFLQLHDSLAGWQTAGFSSIVALCSQGWWPKSQMSFSVTSVIAGNKDPVEGMFFIDQSILPCLSFQAMEKPTEMSDQQRLHFQHTTGVLL